MAALTVTVLPPTRSATSFTENGSLSERMPDSSSAVRMAGRRVERVEAAGPLPAAPAAPPAHDDAGGAQHVVGYSHLLEGAGGHAFGARPDLRLLDEGALIALRVGGLGLFERGDGTQLVHRVFRAGDVGLPSER